MHNLDLEASALLERNRQRIRRIRRRGKLTTHLAPALEAPGDEYRQTACGQASPYVLTTVGDPFQVTCRRCLAIVRRGGPRPKGERMGSKIHKQIIGTDHYEAVLCRPSASPPAYLREADWKRVTCLRCLRKQPAKITRVPVFGRNRGRKMKSLGPIYNRSVREDMKALGIKGPNAPRRR